MQAVGEHNFATWSIQGMFQRVQSSLLVLDTFISDLQAMRRGPYLRESSQNRQLHEAPIRGSPAILHLLHACTKVSGLSILLSSECMPAQH